MASATSVKRHRYGPPVEPGLTAAVAAATIVAVKGATLGQRLKSARESRGLGTNELTRLVKLPSGKPLSEGYVSSIESGRREDIPAIHAVAMCAVLRIRVEWLIEGSGPAEFRSGEMPAMETAAKANKPHLERVLEASNKRGRWSGHTIAAARALPDDRELSSWPALLDRMERELRKAIAGAGH